MQAEAQHFARIEWGSHYPPACLKEQSQEPRAMMPDDAPSRLSSTAQIPARDLRLRRRYGPIVSCCAQDHG